MLISLTIYSIISIDSTIVIISLHSGQQLYYCWTNAWDDGSNKPDIHTTLLHTFKWICPAQICEGKNKKNKSHLKSKRIIDSDVLWLMLVCSSISGGLAVISKETLNWEIPHFKELSHFWTNRSWVSDWELALMHLGTCRSGLMRLLRSGCMGSVDLGHVKSFW